MIVSEVPFAEVIGDPVDHSLSPLVHGFWLERLGIGAEYRRTPVGKGELAAFLIGRRKVPGWLGCNVTMPHKLHALMIADDRSDAAVQAGAANLLVPRGGGLYAANTDIRGAMMVIKRLAGDRPPGSVTLLGSGGAARAVLVALKRLGFTQIQVQARNCDEAVKLVAQFQLDQPPAPLERPIESHGLINALPLGMTGAPPLAADLSGMPAGGWVFDLVTSPDPTALITTARKRGLAACGGLAMLVEQAAEAFPLLFGASPPRDQASDAELFRRLAA